MRNTLYQQCISDLNIVKSTLRENANNNSNIILQKIYYIIFRGGLYYRSKQKWKKWQEFGMPIASALCHASRVLVQIPLITSENTNTLKEFRTWLTHNNGDINSLSTQSFEDGFGSRVATHGVDKLDSEEDISGSWFGIKKKLKEVKINAPKSSWNPLDHLRHISDHVRNSSYHKGINIAWGGNGKHHPHGHLISTNGKNGHLYIYCWTGGDNTTPGCLLIGLEPSAPGERSAQLLDEPHHGAAATTAVNGINGGDKFRDPSGNGVFQSTGPEYYDSLCVILDIETIKKLMKDFNPSQLDFLSMGFNEHLIAPTKEDVFDFIKHERNEISHLIFPDILKTCKDDLRAAKKEHVFETAWNLLHYAVYYNRIDLVDCLVDFGIEINGRDSYGRTPLMLCLDYIDKINKPERMIQKLLAHKADPNAVSDKWCSSLSFFCCSYADWRGWTPLAISIHKGNHDIADLLKRSGGTLSEPLITTKQKTL